MIVILNEGAHFLLKGALRIPFDEEPVYDLNVYVNDYTPVPTSVVGDFTLDETDGGPYTIDPTLWDAISIVSNHPVTTYNPPASFTFTNPGPSPLICYGFLVRQPLDGVGVYAERFDAPRTLGAGQSFDLVLTFTGGNCPLT